MTKPKWSICVPCKNRSLVYAEGHRLLLFPNMIHSVRRKGMLPNSAWPVEKAEIVVADFHSDDWPLERWLPAAAHPIPVRIVQVDGPFSVGKAWNRVAAEARGERIWFIDTDMLVGAEFFKRGEAAMDAGMAYLPICWSFEDYGHTRGDWRPTGCGNGCMTRKMWDHFGPRPEFESHGKSDEVIKRRLQRAGKVIIDKCPGFYHQWHPNTRKWKNRHYKREHSEQYEAEKSLWRMAEHDPWERTKGDRK